jgi:hypothetical protein
MPVYSGRIWARTSNVYFGFGARTIFPAIFSNFWKAELESFGFAGFDSRFSFATG